MSGDNPSVLIVGAGPAGTRAAETLVDRGLSPIVVDEGARSGGQIYRRPPEGFRRPASALYGFEARKAQAVHAALDDLRERIDYRPGTLIWNIEGGDAQALGPAGIERIRFDSIILATGAMDRVIPFPGWTLPGVFTMGGAQVALKAQGCAIGDPVVFMGTGPLLYLVAYQYAHAGAHVAAVLDTSRASQAIPVLPGLLWGGRTFAKGVWYIAWLRAAGIPVRAGITPVAGEGESALQAVRYRDRRGREHHVACTGLGIGYSVKSEVQLAELAGCEMAFDPLAQQWLPQADGDGRALPKARSISRATEPASPGPMPRRCAAGSPRSPCSPTKALRSIERFRRGCALGCEALCASAMPWSARFRLPSTWRARSRTRPSSAAARPSRPAIFARAALCRQRR